MQLRVLLAPPGRSRVPCKLPGALVLESSVGYLGTNRPDEVVAVQASLNCVVPALGGPGTPLVEDGRLSDPLQRAILRFQEHWTPYRDSKLSPGGKTIHALNRAVGASLAGAVPALPGLPNLVAGPAAPKPANPPRPVPASEQLAMFAALARVVLVKYTYLPAAYAAAIQSVRIATRAVAYAERLPMPRVARTDPDRLAFLLVAKHFKLHEDKPAVARAAVKRIETMLRRMAITLVSRAGLPNLTPGDDIFISLWKTPRAVAGHPGYTWYGGYAERHRLLGTLHGGEQLGKLLPDYADRIYLTPEFDTGSTDYQSHVIIHELAHFIGDMQGGWTLDDLGYAYSRTYVNNSSHQRQHNADAYACMVREIGFGTTNALTGAQYAHSGGPPGFGRGPVVQSPGVPVLPPTALGAADPFAYPSGYASH